MRETEWPYVDWHKMIESRTENVIKTQIDEGVGAVVMTQWDNIRYATDYPSSEVIECAYNGFTAIITREGDSYIYSIFVGQDSVVKLPIEDHPRIKELIGIPSVYPYWAIAATVAKQCVKKLKELGAKKVGFDTLSSDAYEVFKRELPAVEYKQIGWQLLKARAIKNDEEIKLIEANCAMTDSAFNEAIPVIKKGNSTERQIAAAFAKAMYEQGIEIPSHIVVIGDRPRVDKITTYLDEFSVCRQSVYPYSNTRPLVNGDICQIDFGFIGKGGYGTDLARTFFIGNAIKEARNAYNDFLEMYLKCINSLKPGMKTSEVGKMTRKAIKDLGYGDYLVTLGHGIGIRMEEVPHLPSPGGMIEDITLQPNMVLCLEITLRNAIQGMMLEDQIVITENGMRVLTHTQYD